MSKNSFGISVPSLWERFYDTEYLAKRCKETGFEFVQLGLDPELGKRCEVYQRYGIDTVVHLKTDGNFTLLQDRPEIGAKAAADDVLACFSGTSYFPDRYVAHPPLPLIKMDKQSTDRIRVYCQVFLNCIGAAAPTAALSIENLIAQPRELDSEEVGVSPTLSSVHELVCRLDMPCVKVCLDIGHFWVNAPRTNGTANAIASKLLQGVGVVHVHGVFHSSDHQPVFGSDYAHPTQTTMSKLSSVSEAPWILEYDRLPSSLPVGQILRIAKRDIDYLTPQRSQSA